MMCTIPIVHTTPEPIDHLKRGSPDTYEWGKDLRDVRHLATLFMLRLSQSYSKSDSKFQKQNGTITAK